MGTKGEMRRSSVQTRADVLAAAERLFAARGYRGTSLQEIGREAGLSRGTPGYLFGSKSLLYAEVLARIFARAEVALMPAYARYRPDGPPGPAGLAGLVRAHLELLASEPSLVRLIQWETLDNDARIVVDLWSHARPLVELIQNLSELISPRRLPAEKATELLVSIAALCWLPVAYADALGQAVGADSRSREAIDSQTKRIVEFVLAQVADGAASGNGGARGAALAPFG